MAVGQLVVESDVNVEDFREYIFKHVDSIQFAAVSRNILKDVVDMDQSNFFVNVHQEVKSKDALLIVKIMIMGLSTFCFSICLMLIVYFSVRVLRTKYSRIKADEESTIEIIKYGAND